MTAAVRLIIFDVDGTLVDSQADIVASMTSAFQGVGLPVPERAKILSIVGLSLDVAIPILAPGQSRATFDQMIEGYKAAYLTLRASQGTQNSSPLYPGIREVLGELNAVPEFLLGVATGKSRRGLDALLEGHQMTGLFLTQQVADHHPSKPHPAMVLTAMAETGVAAENAVMIGDTEFDIAMAQAAGVRSIGVSWGYHTADRLDAADKLVHSVPDLLGAIRTMWE